MPVGAWRSLVARYTGGVEVVGSSPAAPTMLMTLIDFTWTWKQWQIPIFG